MENKLHGEGVFTWPDGRSYRGSYENDAKSGFGIYEWPDGKKFEGQWKNGNQDGEGIFTNSQGKSRKGIWENGKRINWVGKVIENEVQKHNEQGPANPVTTIQEESEKPSKAE